METASYMVRYVSPFFYTLEFLLAVLTFALVLYFFLRDVDRKSLLIFIIAGVINTCIELFIQGFGIRIVEDAYFFGLPIGFPFVSFIMGFYEGGVKTLLAYHFVKLVVDRNKFSKKFFAFLFFIVLGSFITYSSITVVQSSMGTITPTLTVRDMFSPVTITLLVIAFGGSALYFLSNKDIPRSRKWTLLYYELGVVLYLLAFLLPLHISSLRYIGVEMGSSVPAGLFEQIVLMYGYFLFFEGVGVNIIIYPTIYSLKLVEFQQM
jgi:hypothetical protein